jgi:signal transduction histidine kinase
MVTVSGSLLVLLGLLYFGLTAAVLPRLGLRDRLLAHALATLCVALIVVPLRNKIVSLTNHLMRRKWQSSQDLLREVSGALSHTIDPANLHTMLVDDLPRRLRVQGATLWMLEPPDDRTFVALGRDRSERGAMLFADGASATRVGAARTHLPVPQHDAAGWAPLLSAQGVHLALPLRMGERLVGIYGVGAPLGRRAYQPHVIELLLTLAPAMASAIENARAYTEIARLNERLRALDQLKDEFIESVGHELRTPLTSLTLALQLLAHQPQMARDMAHVVQGSVDRLQALVDRVLQMHALAPGERDAGEAAGAVVELLPLLRDIAREYAPSAHAKGLRLEVEVPPTITVRGDSAALRRALHEVLDNAVRYSQRGTITVTAEEQDGLALITVVDEGPGIPADERDRLFDAFYRGRGARALAETPGAGLGLSLARRDIEALGGRIWLGRSGPEGSRMCVSLTAVALLYGELGAPEPRAASHDAQAKQLPERALHPLV